MLRNGRTGQTWHLVVDHIMLVMKMRSSSPTNRPVKRIYVHVQKKKVAIYSQLSKKKLCSLVDLLNDYICALILTGLYCESLI